MNITYDLIESTVLASCSDVFVSPRGSTSAIVEFDSPDDHPIKIMFDVGKHTGSAKGIHLFEIESVTDLEYRLYDAIETALKDGFNTIWIHA